MAPTVLRLPAEHRRMFGAVGFCRGKPVQIVGPYQVPLGPLVEVMEVRRQDTEVMVTGHGQVGAKVAVDVVPQGLVSEYRIADGGREAGAIDVAGDGDAFRLSLKGKAVEEIAEELDLKENSVYRLKNRVKERLIQEIRHLREELE